MVEINWELLSTTDEGEPSTPLDFGLYRRAKVPGGWLVNWLFGDTAGGLTFVPDPNHEWK
jgi:hypothetical protein